MEISADKQHYEELVTKADGRFRMSVLVQKRLQELARGGFPLIQVDPGQRLIEVAFNEVLADKIELTEAPDLGILGGSEESASEAL